MSKLSSSRTEDDSSKFVFNSIGSNKVVKRFKYDSVGWFKVDPIIETLIELPDIVHLKVDLEDLISIRNDEFINLFKTLYTSHSKRTENYDLIEEWHIKTKRLGSNKLKYIRKYLDLIRNDYYKDIHRRYEQNRSIYVKSNEPKAYSKLNDDTQFIVRMRPIIKWTNGSLTVSGTVKDMFGINASNQWFMTNLCYKIESIIVGYFDDKGSITEIDISDRVFIVDTSVYSTLIRHDEQCPSKNQHCTIFNDSLTKSISVRLNSFQEGGTYNGAWNSLIRRRIPNLNLYQLYRIPSNVRAPLIIPFQWHVPLKQNEHLVNAKISIEMTADRLVDKDVTCVNYLTKGTYDIERQISSFYFNLVPFRNLHFNLESVERTVQKSTLKIVD